MALNKQPLSINFAQGLSNKSDPYQIQVGKFSQLSNAVFDKVGRLTKRDGFPIITSLPNASQTTLTTLNDNLIATGTSLYAFSKDTDQWLNKGTVQPVSLDVLPLVRVSTSQSTQDSVTASNGLVCLTYVDNSQAYYQVSDSSTGQQVVSRTALSATATNPRVFIIGNYFAITFIDTVAGSPTLECYLVNILNPSQTGQITVSGTVLALTTGYDGVVMAGQLYLAWCATSTSIQVTYITSALTVAAPVTISSHKADLMTLTADSPNNLVWVSFWDSSSTNGFTIAYTQILAIARATTQIITGKVLTTMTSSAASLSNTVFYEVSNTYAAPYPTGGIRSDFINSVSCTTGGTVTQNGTILRSVGLASKAFRSSTGTVYMLATYGEANQPTYFLIDSIGNIYLRLAYSNGGGYKVSQILPSVTALGSDAYNVAYLIKDFLATVNKGTNNPAGTPSNAIYTQTGVNLATFSINSSGQYSSEIAGALHLTGGQLWEYDGVRPVEHGFHVWPEDVAGATITSGGSVGVGTYYYQFTYEWTDNQGNLHRSAPSIPISITTTGSTSTNTLYVPTLRLTYKVSPNPVRIVGYRWSVAQQVYYQFTSITSPALNDTTVDYVTITDTKSDAQILGQTLLYTTGGVAENLAAPAVSVSCLFKSRLFLVDAEDKNLLWFSKQVIETTPVELSDLLTLYIAPTSGAQGSTGPITALSAMDDKLIIFKRDAIYYLTGTGPDNTGANNDFSDPIFITSSVGCANPSSIVLTPSGIMFQSDKGIWLLGRDLGTSYIGADVDNYNAQTVVSAQSIPATNQVRFMLDNSTTLMYDYYVGQWGTHSNVSAISSCLYKSAQTYLNAFGQVLQETADTYLDGSTPVVLSFTTSWINVAGLQGYERLYEIDLLGTYYTPFKLNVQLAYDYNDSPAQATLVSPDNASGTWGSDSVWGAGSGWSKSNVFEARVFPIKQKCESFQITINEVYDSSLAVPAGQGLSLSGMLLLVGGKKGVRTQKSSGRSFG